MADERIQEYDDSDQLQWCPNQGENKEGRGMRPVQRKSLDNESQ